MITGKLHADTISKIMLLQSMVVSLPSKAVLGFVCEGLRDLPGVADVQHIQAANNGERGPEYQDDVVRFSIECRNHSFGDITVRVSDAAKFDPYIAYVHNLSKTIALTMIERKQRLTIEKQQRALEQQLQEQTLALKETEVLYQSLFNSIRDAIIVVGMERHIMAVNPAFSELFGFEPDEVIGEQTIMLYVDEQEFKKMGVALREQAFDPGIATTLNYRKKDGKTFPGETNAYRLHDHAGNHIGFVGVIRDVTQRLQVEEELAQIQKMESVGRLAGGIAHDFNNTLTIIMGHNELAMSELEENHPVRADLEEIDKAATRSAQLVSQLLAFARKQPISPRPLDLNATIEDMLRMLRRLIGEDIELEWRPGPNARLVSMDPVQLDQLLANLVVNARDAITDVGKITIETSNIVIKTEDALANDELEPGDYLLIRVTDSGHGMDAEVLDQIFEPFFTTKEYGHGTGLGLSMVYGIIDQNHGFVTVSSEPGAGTTFNLYFPTLGEDQVADSADISVGSVSGGKETILVVEDEKPLLTLIERMLGTLGYQVKSAQNGAEALDLVDQHKGSIDLLLTDIVMPEMSGHELQRQVSTINPEMKVLFMSGYSASPMVSAKAGNGLDLLQKPFSSRKLGSHIRRVLDTL